MMEKEQKILNVGIVGMGEVAQTIHLPVLETLTNHYRISALCDISPKLVAYMGEKYDVTHLYTDAVEMVNQADLDVIFILSSDEYHAEYAIAAANNGKHVLIEKPMTLTLSEADAIINARDKNGVKMMVGYMRRYASAFEQAVKEVGNFDNITFARVRDIIGPNKFFVESIHNVVSFNDFPEGASEHKSNRAVKLIKEATGLDESSPYFQFWRYLCALSSHDLSAMREVLGMPKGVVGAKLTNNGGATFLSVIFDYGKFSVIFETGIDQQGRFDAHVEVYSPTKTVRVQYNTPYIRHLPTHLYVSETIGETYTESIIRPTFKDSFTIELLNFHNVIINDLQPKTTPEDFKNDLIVFKMIVDALVRNSSDS